jgi:hypothetical protein
MANRSTKGKLLAGAVAGSVFSVPSELLATSVDRHVMLMSQPVELIAVEEIHSVVGGASAAVRPRKITDTSAPGAAAGATVIELCQSLDLTATANTRVSGTLVTTATKFAAGDRLAEDFSGTLTGLVGRVTYWFRVL